MNQFYMLAEALTRAKIRSMLPKVLYDGLTRNGEEIERKEPGSGGDERDAKQETESSAAERDSEECG
jgi:hypothetical protein